MAGRDLEREIVPLVESERLGLMVWSPLAGGLRSGRYGRDGLWPDDVVREIAGSRGVSVARIALAWVLHRPFVTSVIVGATSVEQLEDDPAATDIKLTEDEMERLAQVSALRSEHPGSMIEHQHAERCPVDRSMGRNV